MVGNFINRFEIVELDGVVELELELELELLESISPQLIPTLPSIFFFGQLFVLNCRGEAQFGEPEPHFSLANSPMIAMRSCFSRMSLDTVKLSDLGFLVLVVTPPPD